MKKMHYQLDHFFIKAASYNVKFLGSQMITVVFYYYHKLILHE